MCMTAPREALFYYVLPTESTLHAPPVTPRALPVRLLTLSSTLHRLAHAPPLVALWVRSASILSAPGPAQAGTRPAPARRCDSRYLPVNLSTAFASASMWARLATA